MNFYNDIDHHACEWITQLIFDGLIPPGVVDTRSITDLDPDELRSFTQCHFFAGISGWSYALQLAGWPASRRVWSMSCPCQPFSVAGKGDGKDDERHLWPTAFNLIRECRPDTVFGEQVENAIGHGWLDDIRADLEGEGYACGDATLGAHSAGADHIRQRLYWVADVQYPQRRPLSVHREDGCDGQDGGRKEAYSDFGARGEVRGLANGISAGLEGHGRNGGYGNEPGRVGAQQTGSTAESGDTCGGVGVSAGNGLQMRQQLHGELSGEGSGQGCEFGCGVGDSNGSGREAGSPAAAATGYGGAANPASSWADSFWIPCRDGKYRRIPAQSEIFPLADGLPYKLARRGSVRAHLLRGAGNSICPQTAAEFIKAFMSIIP